MALPRPRSQTIMYGVLTPGKVLFIRTRQQIDGWMDAPKVLSALIPAP